MIETIESLTEKLNKQSEHLAQALREKNDLQDKLRVYETPIFGGLSPQLRIHQLFEHGTWSDYSSGEAIWCLMYALRGPDDQNGDLKIRTTWRLRAAIAPRFFNARAHLDDTLPPDKPNQDENYDNFQVRIIKELQEKFETAQRHFLYHYAVGCVAYWKYMV